MPAKREGGLEPRERALLLALRPLGLGDFLTGVPAYKALAHAWPDHIRVLAAPPQLAPLAALTGGALHAVVPAAPLSPLHPSLRRCDVAVNLHGRGPQSHRVLAGARPRRLIAWSHAEVEASAGMPEWSADEHETARWCRLLRESGIPADPADLELRAPPRGTFGAYEGATVIHPGAASPARRWPVGRFAAVARAEVETGRRVVVTGGRDDVRRAQAVARSAGLGDGAVLAGRTDLVGLASVVARAARVVCGDTGVAHVATAYGTPSVVLFGPTSPEHWGPPRRPWHLALWAGRRGDPHGPVTDAGLLEISVDQVLAELARMPPHP